MLLLFHIISQVAFFYYADVALPLFPTKMLRKVGGNPFLREHNVTFLVFLIGSVNSEMACLI